MKFIRLLVTALMGFTSFCFVPANAQKTYEESAVADWTIANIIPSYKSATGNASFSFGTRLNPQYFYGDFSLAIDDNEQVVPVLIGKRNWGIIKLNHLSKEIWRYEGAKEGELKGISIFGEQILVVVFDEDELQLVLIDKLKGTKVKEQKIKLQTYRRVFVQNDSEGKFQNILLTSYIKKLEPQLLLIQNDLTISSPITLQSNADFLSFAGSVVNSGGDTYIADSSPDALTVSKYSKTGAFLQKVFTPLPRRKLLIATVMQLLAKGDGIILALNYVNDDKDVVNRLFRANFGDAKITTSEEQVLNKAFAKSATLTTAEGARTGTFQFVDNSMPVAIEQWKDKIILLTEIRSTVSAGSGSAMGGGYSRSAIRNEAWFGGFYDQSLKLTTLLGLDRMYESNLETSTSIGIHRYDDKLVVICPALNKPGRSSLTFSQINLNTAVIDKAVTLDGVNGGLATAFESAGTIWFKSDFLVEKLVGKLMSKTLKSATHRVGLE